jgi:peroxiredoxin Q/BCP
MSDLKAVDLKIGDSAPNFTLPTDNEGTVSLSDFKGKAVVLYFYPKDDTPGCTTESCGFRDHKKDFESLNAQIIGVSKDSVKKHDKFKAKYDLNFPLVSDENGTLCEDYGVWKEKSMYGKTYMGIVRSTFLIDADGKIAQIWNKVKVPGHVEAVAEALNAHGAAA